MLSSKTSFRNRPVRSATLLQLFLAAISVCMSTQIAVAKEIVWSGKKSISVFDCESNNVSKIRIRGVVDLTDQSHVTISCPRIVFEIGSSVEFSNFIYFKVSNNIAGSAVLVSRTSRADNAPTRLFGDAVAHVQSGVDGAPGEPGRDARCFSSEPLLFLRAGRDGMAGTRGHNGVDGRHGPNGRDGASAGSAIFLLSSAGPDTSIEFQSIGNPGSNGVKGNDGQSGGKGGDGGHGGTGGYGGFCVPSAQGGNGGDGGDGGNGGDAGNGGNGGNGGAGGSLTVYLSLEAATSKLTIDVRNSGGTGGNGGQPGGMGLGGRGGQAGLRGDGGGKFKNHSRHGPASEGRNGIRGSHGLNGTPGVHGLDGRNGLPGSVRRVVLGAEDFSRFMTAMFPPVTSAMLD